MLVVVHLGEALRLKTRKKTLNTKIKMQKFFFCFFLIALIYSKRYSILFYSIWHNLMRWHAFDALAYI
nr:MAG TPA: hypothetical protein [Caudoviricetes sp.]